FVARRPYTGRGATASGQPELPSGERGANQRPPLDLASQETGGLTLPFRSMLSLLENLGHYVHFAARSLVALPGAVLRPRELASRLFDILIGALPLACVAGLALGVVLWLHLHHVLERF